MFIRMRQGAAFVVVAGMLTCLGPGVGGGEEFRVESKVFVGTDKEPRTQSTTIFHQGIIYDYLQKPAEITVFDPSRGLFILLDPGRRVRSELTAQEVLGLTENLRQWAGTQTDGFLKFLGSPKFDEQFDERKGELLFESPWLSYRVTAVDAESDAIAQQYREFCDWFARLNTRLNPGYKLALARLVINEALYHRRQVPQEVTLTVQPKRGLTLQKAVMRSQHQFVRRLVESDRDRVAQTGQFMAIFQPVEFDEYVKQPDL